MKNLTHHRFFVKCTVFLLVFMLTAGLLTSCAASKVDEKKLDAEPVQAIADAFEETSGIDLEKMLSGDESDRFHLVIGVETPDADVDFECAVDTSEDRMMLRLDSPELFDLSMYLQSGGALVLKSDALLGDDAYGLRLSDLPERLEDAPLWDVLEIPFSEMDAETQEILRTVAKTLSTITFSEDGETGTITDEFRQSVLDILNGAKHRIDSETLKLQDGSVDAYILEYTIDGEMIEKLFSEYFDTLADLMQDFFGKTVAENYMELLNGVFSGEETAALFDDFEAELDFGIAKKSGKIVSVELKTDDLTVTADLGCDPAESEEYRFTAATESDTYEIIYQRQGDKKGFSRTLTVYECTEEDGETDRERISEFVLDVEKDGKEKDFSAKLTGTNRSGERFDAELDYQDEAYDLRVSTEGLDVLSMSGTFSSEKDRIALTIDELNGDRDMKIRFEADTTEACEKAPTAFIDILEMDEEQLTDVMTNFMSFANLFGAGTYGYPDDSFYDDYDYDYDYDFDYDFDDYDFD